MVRLTLWSMFAAALLGISNAYGFDDYDGVAPVTCEDLDCSSNQVCGSLPTGNAICALKSGYSCTPNDYCDGGYYCPRSGVCGGGEDGIAEGSSCPAGIGCKQGLYCDQKQQKCLKIEGKEFCTGDYECNQKCPYKKGCYCDNGKCLPNP